MAEEVVAKDRGSAPLRIRRKPGDVMLGAILVEKLGNGNCAVVWKGKDTDGSSCAVKIFEPPEKGDWTAVHAAFMRGTATMERLAACGVEVPKTICKIRRTSGAAIVTDFADHGGSADLPALQWPPRRIAAFFNSVCEAIAFAHEHGVYHRCLKPSNILLGDDFEPFVTDFDMVDHPSVEPDAGGYNSYAAPEALKGERAESPAADIYSLGRILYFLLLGEDPNEPVQVCPDLLPLIEQDQPVGLVRIIRKCTSSDPDRRYPDVQALMADLDRYDNAVEVGVDLDPDSPASQRISTLPASRRARGSRPSGEAMPRSKRIVSADGSWAFEYTDEETELPPVSLRGQTPGSVRGTDLSNAAQKGQKPPLLSSSLARTLAIAGGLALAAAIGLLAASPVPSATVLKAAHITAAVGVALLTFALPQHYRYPTVFRVIVALTVGLSIYLVDPSRAAVLRLGITLGSKNASNRAAAVKELAREGKRRFDGRDLSTLDLSGIDLGKASFTKAILKEANLSNSYLVESSFNGADLSSAALYGSDLTSATIEDVEGWTTARCDKFTRFPEGWTCKRGHPASSAAKEPTFGAPKKKKTTKARPAPVPAAPEAPASTDAPAEPPN